MSFTDLQIRHAEKLARELKAEGVIIIAFPIVCRPQYHKAVSYGDTRITCAKLGEVLNKICDQLCNLPDDSGRGNPQSPETRRRQDGDAK